MKTPKTEAIPSSVRDIPEVSSPTPAEPEGGNSLMPGRLDAGLDAPDAVEAALAKALGEAAAAGRFDVVAQLARELEARRMARMANVVPLSSKARARAE